MTAHHDGLYHIARVESRLETVTVKRAFTVLMTWARGAAYLYLLPVSRGAFSAIHLSSLEHARPYADCEFGFKGARDHMRFWFCKPAFDTGLIDDAKLTSYFEGHKRRRSGEIIVDISTPQEADEIIGFIDRAFHCKLA